MLIMIVCSGLYNKCQEPIIIDNNYKDFNTCITTGYKFAMNSMEVLDTKEINDNLIYYKFICTIDSRPQT
jgi:hypothetical protein